MSGEGILIRIKKRLYRNCRGERYR